MIFRISQTYVRPIVRGKPDEPVEFGAKLTVSLSGTGWLAWIICVALMAYAVMLRNTDLLRRL